MTGFGCELRRLIEVRGMSVTDLSRKSGLPRSTIYRHLSGDIPIRSSIGPYARALEIPDDELLTMAGYPVLRTGPKERVKALMIEVEELDPEQINALWDMVAILRKLRSH